LEIKFPESVEECAIKASEFEKISYNGVMSNVIGVVDGYLVGITTPPKKFAKNVRSYFSGHYQKYGINVQACCDANCRFTFIGIGGPGVTNDRSGLELSGLDNKIKNIPGNYIVIGDCAYKPTEKMIPIYGGELALYKHNDNFNFYASQMRIRIEMAFGLMTRKWAILQHPLTNPLPKIKNLICCIARLHNFVIDQRDTTINEITVEKLSIKQQTQMYTASILELEEMNNEEYVVSKSLMRESLVRKIKQAGLQRPINRLLNKRKFSQMINENY
jgi:DDE superfamily endonuclease